MVKVNERQLANNSLTLAQWAQRAIRIAGIELNVRFRGDKLHILCEGRECPNQKAARGQLVEALMVTNINDLMAASGQYPIDQVFLYGRKLGENRPDWTETIDLNQLYKHQQKYRDIPNIPVADLTIRSEEMSDMPLNPLVSHEEMMTDQMVEIVDADAEFDHNQARQGNPEAIARYLGENLSSLGVQVKVVAKSLQRKKEFSHKDKNASGKERRLWIFCESGYSPDPSLLAAPIAQQLRELRVEGYRDAVIISQVTGEETPDWMVRVDLTPPEQMLQEWASWGDVEAIVRLLNEAVNPYMSVTAVLKETTLHISCMAGKGSAVEQLNNSSHPEKLLVMRSLAPILNSLAPRGIQAAIAYGHTEESSAAPSWVEWLDLPAARRPELAISALDLATDGNEAALIFLMGRLLNPDLDQRLATGGIRVQVRRKEDLLHIMTDAPLCPPQRQVSDPVAKFVRELEIPNISGIRIYGRRAGQKQPTWSYGVDFVARQRQAQESTPEFATSDAYGSTDEISLGNGSGERLNDVTVITEVTDVSPEIIEPEQNLRYWQKAWYEKIDSLANMLVRSQLFTPSEKRQNLLSLPGQATYQGVKVALVWGTAGIMLTWGLDLVLGQIIRANLEPSKESIAVTQNTLDRDEVADNQAEEGNREDNSFQLPQVSLNQTSGENPRDFESSGFTKPGDTEVNLGRINDDIDISNIKIKLDSPYPSFNNQQLDQKLALYQKRVAEQGPPDILILGSSRALRGIDPQALQKSLAAQGYGKLKIFNFGINGATAQIADLIVRRCLTVEQLPKMIIWADGARAFNSGRADLTYNAITASTGYKKLVAGTLDRPNSLDGQTAKNLEPFTITPLVAGGITNSQSLDGWLNESLAAVSSTYQERERLHNILREGFANGFKFTKPNPQTPQQLATHKRLQSWDGFLPITIRFNPSSYYQKHPRVSGDYDNDYQNFQLAGRQIVALQSFVQFTQANQIPVIFVNLPLTKEYLDPIRSRYEQEFEIYMLRVALNQGFIFRNWNKLWPNRNDYFSDPSHLNRYGATAVSGRLGQDPMIPWPKK